MICAVVKDDIVENCIVVEPEQIAELEAALHCELVDAKPYGLRVGDLRTQRGWTRNEGGEQVVLPELEPEDYSSYKLAVQEANYATARAEQAEAVAGALSQGQSEQDEALVELASLLDENQTRLDEQDAALVELAALIASK